MKDQIFQLGLASSLIIGLAGSTYIASINKEFSVQYGRIVDSLVAGVLGAVAGGTGVAAYMTSTALKANTEEKARQYTEPVNKKDSPIT